MLTAFGSHIRHNVVGYIAIFLALGGVGYAAATVGTNDIQNGAVTAKKLHNKAVTKSKLAKNAGVVRGNGKLVSRSFSSGQVGFLPTPDVLARIPGFGEVQFLYCGTAPDRQMRVRLLSSDNSSDFFFSAEVRSGGIPAGTGQQHNVDQDGGALGGGGGTPLITPTFTPNGFTLGQQAKWDFQVWRGDGADTTGAHVSVGAVNGFDNQCHVNAQTIIQK
jgi:hypothetical protein